MSPNRACSDPTMSPLAVMQATELQEHIVRALNRLGEHHREIILLRDFHDLSYKVISQVLDIPLGTVTSRLHKARSMLKNELEDVL